LGDGRKVKTTSVKKKTGFGTWEQLGRGSFEGIFEKFTRDKSQRDFAVSFGLKGNGRVQIHGTRADLRNNEKDQRKKANAYQNRFRRNGPEKNSTDSKNRWYRDTFERKALGVARHLQKRTCRRKNTVFAIKRGQDGGLVG